MGEGHSICSIDVDSASGSTQSTSQRHTPTQKRGNSHRLRSLSVAVSNRSNTIHDVDGRPLTRCLVRCLHAIWRTILLTMTRRRVSPLASTGSSTASNKSYFLLLIDPLTSNRDVFHTQDARVVVNLGHEQTGEGRFISHDAIYMNSISNVATLEP
jgi:hypothetical protein